MAHRDYRLARFSEAPDHAEERKAAAPNGQAGAVRDSPAAKRRRIDEASGAGQLGSCDCKCPACAGSTGGCSACLFTLHSWSLFGGLAATNFVWLALNRRLSAPEHSLQSPVGLHRTERRSPFAAADAVAEARGVHTACQRQARAEGGRGCSRHAAVVVCAGRAGESPRSDLQHNQAPMSMRRAEPCGLLRTWLL
jgi:hypothetical protein